MKVIECPRDAMQGIYQFIPTESKIKYVNQLLKVGFDTIDFGSFVSPKAVPQMKDTAEVLEKLDVENSHSKLLAIIANERGAEDALKYTAIDYLGFPLSISETFQQRNTNKSILQAFNVVENIQNNCIKAGRRLVVYISMGFGNPYGDPYSADEVLQFIKKLNSYQVEIISMSDTIGIANPALITQIFTNLKSEYPEIEFGAHLHSNPSTAIEKIEAAYLAGCKRFDGALNGLGGCPFAKDELVGNMATETIIKYLQEQDIQLDFNWKALQASMTMVKAVFYQ